MPAQLHEYTNPGRGTPIYYPAKIDGIRLPDHATHYIDSDQHGKDAARVHYLAITDEIILLVNQHAWSSGQIVQRLPDGVEEFYP